MSKPNTNVDLRSVLRFAEPFDTAGGEAELRLDAILDAQANRSDPAVGTTNAANAVSRLERTRQHFADVLLPIAKALTDKYAEKGVKLEVDAQAFLDGGRELTIVIEYNKTGLRLEGTVTPTVIAFRQTRYTEFDRAGLTASGTTLRSRDLTDTKFKDFLCERIVALVSAAVGKRA